MATYRYFITKIINRIQALQGIAKLYHLNNLVEAAIRLPVDASLPLELQGLSDVHPSVVQMAFPEFSVVLDIQATYDFNEQMYIDRDKRIKAIKEWFSSLDPATQKKVKEYASLSRPFA